MSSIRHCGGARRAVAYWLIPDADEAKVYKHIVLLVVNCPACNQFIMEWYGVNLENKRRGQHRIGVKEHEAWIARTKTDLDEQMELARQPKANTPATNGLSPIKSLRVKASLNRFPWNFKMAVVR